MKISVYYAIDIKFIARLTGNQIDWKDCFMPFVGKYIDLLLFVRINRDMLKMLYFSKLYHNAINLNYKKFQMEWPRK